MPDRPVLVRGDAGRLQQVLLNLLTNAIRYAPAPAQIDVRLEDAGDEVRLVVEDTGPGIPADELPTVFRRFHQVTSAEHRGEGGLGLGLYLARQIVEGHGGRIEAASTVGEGTTFTAHLPRLPAEEEPEGERPGALRRRDAPVRVSTR